MNLPKSRLCGHYRDSFRIAGKVNHDSSDARLDACGNISRAAEALGLERSHLYRKMKALGIQLGE